MSPPREPHGPRPRPIPMTRTPPRAFLLLAALLLVGGCGSAEPTSSDRSDSVSTKTPDAAPATVGSCPADSPAVNAARTVATVDLDGEGGPEPVRLTASGTDCPNVLFAKVGGRYLAAPLPEDGPPLSVAFGVDLPGHQGALLVTRRDHPRGGFQLRIFAAAGEELKELVVDGHSLVPFVVLDVLEHPLSVDCQDGGVVITEAVAHEPRGVAFAWDVKRTTYAVDGAQVTKANSSEIADNVLPKQLEAKYPDLVKHTAFASCRAAG